MKAVIQRVSNASVSVDGKTFSEIQKGLLVLLGIGFDDTELDIDWLTSKIANLRIFNDTNGVMNKSLMDVDGEILVVSQFTLMASTKKGHRPSYIKAASPEIAVPLYEGFLDLLESKIGKKIAKGIFGADMRINLCNDGPVTILFDTHNRT